MPFTLAGAADAISYYFGNKSGLYAALFTGDPSGSGVELTTTNAPGYTRVSLPLTLLDAATQDSANNRANAASDAALDWPTATADQTAVPSWFGIMSAATGGVLYAYDETGITGALASGERVRIPTGKLIARAIVSGNVA